MYGLFYAFRQRDHAALERLFRKGGGFVFQVFPARYDPANTLYGNHRFFPVFAALQSVFVVETERVNRFCVCSFAQVRKYVKKKNRTFFTYKNNYKKNKYFHRKIFLKSLLFQWIMWYNKRKRQCLDFSVELGRSSGYGL